MLRAQSRIKYPEMMRKPEEKEIISRASRPSNKPSNKYGDELVEWQIFVLWILFYIALLDWVLTYYKVLPSTPSTNCHKTDHKMTLKSKFNSTIFRVWKKYVVNKIWKSALENLNVVCALFIWTQDYVCRKKILKLSSQ